MNSSNGYVFLLNFALIHWTNRSVKCLLSLCRLEWARSLGLLYSNSETKIWFSQFLDWFALFKLGWSLRAFGGRSLTNRRLNAWPWSWSELVLPLAWTSRLVGGKCIDHMSLSIIITIGSSLIPTPLLLDFKIFELLPTLDLGNAVGQSLDL